MVQLEVLCVCVPHSRPTGVLPTREHPAVEDLTDLQPGIRGDALRDLQHLLKAICNGLVVGFGDAPWGIGSVFVDIELKLVFVAAED